MTTRGISIALATFNGAAYLEAQLRSLAAQTLLPLELVVTDDGSDDATTAMIGDFARTAPFPVYLHENDARLGYRANFMQAAALCRSDLIAFCDQDDVWEPHKLATMAPLFDEPDTLLAYHNATITDDDGAAIGHLYATSFGVQRMPPLAENPWRLIKGFTQVFRRDLLRYAKLWPQSIDPYWPDECLAHDQWFLFLASVLGNTARAAAPLASYRQHRDNRHGWTPQNYLEPRPHFLLQSGFIAAAANRVELLSRMATAADADERASIMAAIPYYQQLYEWLAERNSVYETSSFAARARTVGALIRQGAYGAGRGPTSFGWTGLLMDVCAGVVWGPHAKRLL
jgi:glycosyltransferase involved in cell wall biosynthesis